MRSSSLALVAAIVVAGLWSSRAQAQPQPQGFAVERLYPSAPGGGWVVMDALDMRGGLGGVVGMTVGYAHDPLRVPTADGSHLALVARQAFADFGLAVTYDRYRLYLNLASPLVIAGDSGTVGGYQLKAPAVDVGSNPDTVMDARVGFDTRLLGTATGPFRLGAGAQLLIPNGNRSDYVTDGTFRAMLRALFAGDVGSFAYAGQLGVHVRPLDDAPAPGSPQGSELLFGVAGGLRLPLGAEGAASLVIGPEIYGESAFKSLFGSGATGVEALLTTRVEGTRDSGGQVRVKLGTGGGLSPQFGAPEWRFVVGVELFDHSGAQR